MLESNKEFKALENNFDVSQRVFLELDEKQRLEVINKTAQLFGEYLGNEIFKILSSSLSIDFNNLLSLCKKELLSLDQIKTKKDLFAKWATSKKGSNIEVIDSIPFLEKALFNNTYNKLITDEKSLIEASFVEGLVFGVNNLSNLRLVASDNLRKVGYDVLQTTLSSLTLT